MSSLTPPARRSGLSISEIIAARPRADEVIASRDDNSGALTRLCHALGVSLAMPRGGDRQCWTSLPYDPRQLNVMQELVSPFLFVRRCQQIISCSRVRDSSVRHLDGGARQVPSTSCMGRRDRSSGCDRAAGGGSEPQDERAPLPSSK